MISIIISSANNTLLKQVTENITTTIGVPFEIIAIDNSTGQRGICEVYNEGASHAKFDILCFIHEDIIVQTQNWGLVLENMFFNDDKIGLIGVAGAPYKSLSPSPWGTHGIDTSYTNLYQSYKHEKKETKHLYRNPHNVKVAYVACIDGVFICTKKNIFLEHKFDEDTFKGFHVYDVDFSLNIGRTYKVAVTFDILLDHLSEGSYDKAWLQDNIKLHQKWEAILPVNVEGISLQQQQIIEKATFKIFIKSLLQFKMPISIAFNLLWENKKYKELYPKLFLKLNFYLFKKSLRFKK